MAKAKVIVVRAVNGDQRSNPIKIYVTDEDKLKDLPKQFVLRIDDATNSRTEEAVLNLGNSNVGLFASHNPEWLTEAVTGFRRDMDGVTCIIAERLKDDVPTVSKLTKVEAY